MNTTLFLDTHPIAICIVFGILFALILIITAH
jgi:hypothetical protein